MPIRALQAADPSRAMSVSLAPTILVVEDEYLVRSLIALELADAGFGVVEAETAEEGLRALEERPFALVFTDIRLPGERNGWQLAEEARQLQPGVPVIYATGYSEEEPRLVPGGVFLRKPYVPSQVIAEIRKLLDTGRPPERTPDL